jgi:DNA-entry nuclease
MKYFELRKISFALLFTLVFSMVSACSDVSNPSQPTTNDQKTTAETNNASVGDQYKTLENLDYKGQQVITLNNNHTTFSKRDLNLAKGSWQSFSNLDSLNRVGVANAMLSKSLMPTSAREPLNINPTGWKNKKISVNGKSEWLYNRCHLIGYQLTGQNNNPKNLMTGTRSLNDPAMLVYEDKVASYLKTTNHHIRYQVEPIFRGNELVPRGVHMQAKSIEDNEIEFNVYIFNVEQGVTINYADGSSRVADAATTISTSSSTSTNKSAGSSNTRSTSVSTSDLNVHDGDKALVSVKTKPDVQGTIEVVYSSGPSHASGLEPKTSDRNGNISWTWTVGSSTKPGTYNVIIKVSGQTITKHLVVR